MNKPRLIDANALIEWLTKPTGFRTNCEDCSDRDCIDCIIKEALENTPTAYDIDKVVEQLEENAKAVYNEIEGDYINYVALEKAIEIVKGGAE